MKPKLSCGLNKNLILLNIIVYMRIMGGALLHLELFTTHQHAHIQSDMQLLGNANNWRETGVGTYTPQTLAQLLTEFKLEIIRTLTVCCWKTRRTNGVTTPGKMWNKLQLRVSEPKQYFHRASMFHSRYRRASRQTYGYVVRLLTC